jgi:hypothetical protein
MNGGLQNSFARWESLVQVSTTGFVKDWSRHANLMNPCTTGSCGPTMQSWNAFGNTTSARLGKIFGTDGPMHHLPSDLNEG